MKLEPGKFCPLIKADCMGLACSWFTQVRGTDPQSGREVDEWACAITWMPMLQINTAQEVRQGAAATESVRNAVVGVPERAQHARLTDDGRPGLQMISTEGKNETH